MTSRIEHTGKEGLGFGDSLDASCAYTEEAEVRVDVPTYVPSVCATLPVYIVHLISRTCLSYYADGPGHVTSVSYLRTSYEYSFHPRQVRYRAQTLGVSACLSRLTITNSAVFVLYIRALLIRHPVFTLDSTHHSLSPFLGPEDRASHSC